MLSAIAVGWTQPLWNYVRNICSELNDVWIYKTIESPTAVYEIGRAIVAYETEVVFLEIPGGDGKPVEAVVEQIYAQSPTIAIIPICRTYDDSVAAQLAALGLGNPLVTPFSAEQLENALLRSMPPAFQKQKGKLIAFVPARPGSGATTIGLNTAYALAKSFGQKVAFVELDEYAGITGSLLPAEDLDRSVEPNPSLNNYSWKRYVHSVHGVDILPGATTAALTAANRWAIKRLTDIARAQYDLVIAQVPRVTDFRMRVLVHQLERLCLVSNADGTGLVMTRKRIAELEAFGVDAEKIAVALNRCSDSYFAKAFEKALARNLLAVVPDEPKVILEAQAKRHGLAAPGTGFAKSIAAIASHLSGQLEIEVPKRRFFAFW